MKDFFKFGEKVKDYKIRVLNEREIRAGAGILLLGSIFSFLNSFFTGNMYFTQIFIIIFILDFIIRLINPRYAPSLILGRLAVNNQIPEYVGAVQKRFSWGLGLILGLFMFFALILEAIDVSCLLLGLICALCVALLFLESAFGICIGCKIYNIFKNDKAMLCPGGSCKLNKKEKIQKIDLIQLGILLYFFLFIFYIIKFDLIKIDNDYEKLDYIVKDGCECISIEK